MVTIDKDTNLPIYESIDEIPDHFSSVPPINMKGIPEGNVICKLMGCMAQISDTYPEYVMQAGFTILSSIARRRVYLSLNGSKRYPVLWMVVLGPSGYARKTASISMARRILKAIYGNSILLPDDVSPEGLLEQMATKILLKTNEKGVMKWMDMSERYADPEMKILRSQRPYIRDEVSQMYAQMAKPTNAHLEQMLLKLHNCETYDKALVMKRQIVEDPFFTMLLATTPEGFKKYMTKDNIRSGFVARQLPTNPSYQKARKPLQEDSANDEQLIQDVISDFRLIDSVLGSCETSIHASFQEGALQMLDAWCAEREAYYMEKHDDDHGVFIPRFQENASSLALLIEIGNIPNVVDKTKVNTLESLKISRNSMGFALKLIDSVFAPYIDSLGLREEAANIFENGDVAKLERLMQKNRKLSHTKIIQNTKIKTSPLNEALVTLYEAGVLEPCFVKDGSREKSRWYNYIPPDVTKIIFKTDYRDIEVPEYECGMTFKVTEKRESAFEQLMKQPPLSTIKADLAVSNTPEAEEAIW